MFYASLRLTLRLCVKLLGGWIGIEAVADPGFGKDVAGSGSVGFDLLAQITDKHAQVFVLLNVVAAPQS